MVTISLDTGINLLSFLLYVSTNLTVYWLQIFHVEIHSYEGLLVVTTLLVYSFLRYVNWIHMREKMKRSSRNKIEDLN